MDYTVHGILQARILEWVAVPFSSRSSQPMRVLDCRQILYHLSYEGNQAEDTWNRTTLGSALPFPLDEMFFLALFRTLALYHPSSVHLHTSSSEGLSLTTQYEVALLRPPQPLAVLSSHHPLYLLCSTYHNQ